MPVDTRASFLREVAKHDKEIARAFRESFQDIQSATQIRLIEQAIQTAMASGDVEKAVREVLSILQMTEGYFSPVGEAIRTTYLAGAAYQLALFPVRRAPQLKVRFDQHRPEAQAWINENIDRVFTQLTGDVEETVREVLVNGTTNAVPYRTVKRQLVGEKVGDKREGSLIGLAPNQTRAVLRARRELEEGNFAAYRRRTRRVKGFDRVIDKAIKEGRGLTPDEINKAEKGYTDNLLRLRGRTIARTEGNRAMMAGRVRLMEQSIEQGKVPAWAVKKVWRATIGKFTRDHHLELHNTEVAWDERFISPETGFGMKHPLDSDAPAVDCVNCRCIMWIRVDWRAVAKYQRELEAA